MPTISITKKADKSLRSIPVENRKRILKKIQLLGMTPFPPGYQKLQGDDLSVYRVRIGEYRVLYTFEEENHSVIIWRIAHREDVYRL